MGYDIDDILSEVKKRREENEEKIKSEIRSLDESKIDEVKPEPVVEDIEPKVEKVDEYEDVYSTPVKEQTADIPVVKEAEAPKPAPKPVQQPAPQVVQEETVPFDIAFYQTDEEEQKPKKKKGKGKKIILAILCVLLALVIAGGVGTWLYVNNIFDQISEVDQVDEDEEPWKGMDELIENFDVINEADASEISSFRDMIKQWYRNGMPCSSTHVLNVMLIGEDTRGTEIKDDGTRADSAIICSINTDTKQITLTSILRDTYCYFEKDFGDDSTGQFRKINETMSVADVHKYIETVERLYKINIDNHIIVNFDSFATIVDILGGVDIEMTSKEINEINSHQKRYNNTTIEKTFEGDKGTLRLNGKQALAYCRIRKIDSDNMRANRQKTCLNKIFQGVKGANTVQMVKIVNKLIPYVKTDMSKNTMLKIAKYALKQGWANYKIVNNSIPDSRINEKGAGGIFYGTWCWKSDFPQDAYNLQMQIYGKSNIVLARTRVDVLHCAEKGFRSEGAAPVSATITNYNYGEVTTLKSKNSSSDSDDDE